MPIYQLTEMRVTGADKLREYGRRAIPLVEHYGGRILAMSYSGQRGSIIEGHWPDDEIVVLHQWPSRDAFEAFYSSGDYALLKPIRLGAAESRLMLLEPAAAEPS
jgi:uncharacterized protein (DUF1330 family)